VDSALPADGVRPARGRTVSPQDRRWQGAPARRAPERRPRRSGFRALSGRAPVRIWPSAPL